ncbi:molybdate ABC transporter permease subunit [Salinispira pacifica]
MIWQPLLLSLKLGVIVTAVMLVITLPLAALFTRVRRRWLALVESFATLPMVLPPTVVGFYLLIAFAPTSPWGAWLERTIGLRLAFSFPGIVLASCIASLPFMLQSLKSGMQGLDSRLWEASYSLGKGRVETLLRVILPNMRPALFSGMILTFAHTLGEFGVVLMVGGSIPGQTKTISVALFERVEALDFAVAHRYALVMVVISYTAVLALNLLQRVQLERRS